MSTRKYLVDLTDAEREVCQDGVKKLKGTSQKVRRATLLLKSDRGCIDAKIADALDCRTATVEKIRKRFVECGFEQTLHGKKRAKPSVEKILDGEQEAKIVAMRLSDPPAGFGKWTLRLLARKVVELQIVDSISYQTVRRTFQRGVDWQMKTDDARIKLKSVYPEIMMLQTISRVASLCDFLSDTFFTLSPLRVLIEVMCYKTGLGHPQKGLSES